MRVAYTVLDQRISCYSEDPHEVATNFSTVLRPQHPCCQAHPKGNLHRYFSLFTHFDWSRT